LADQPGIDPLVIDRVMLHYQETSASIVQATYQGKPGHLFCLPERFLLNCNRLPAIKAGEK
jgi:CTP:molybdopterin cytidylyltransferase MocA